MSVHNIRAVVTSQHSSVVDVQHDATSALFLSLFVINKVLSAIITCSIELNNTFNGRVGGEYYRPIDGNYMELVMYFWLKIRIIFMILRLYTRLYSIKEAAKPFPN